MSDGPSALESAPVSDVFSHDVVAFGKLILMAYKMSGQGIDPPIPSDFPKDYQIVKNVIMDDYGTPTFYGFIVRLKTPRTNNYVLVIRGTLGIVEWLIDLQSMIPVPFYTYGNVGSGFADTYKTIYLWPHGPAPMGTESAGTESATPEPAGSERSTSTGGRPFAEQVADALQAHAESEERAAPDLPAPRLSLAGHSLGSALITLYAVERLVYTTIPIDTFYTFASPLVGDPTFGAAFDALRLPVTNRIFDNWDPVPALPPLSGFAPVGAAKEIKLDSNYYCWDPLCSHSMDTYLNYFDRAHKPATACTNLIPWLSMARAVTERAGTERIAMEAAAPAVAAAAPTTLVRQGSTTITITIQTSGG